MAKQIARREAELDSLSAPSKKNVSVIVRCSTPDPEVTCSKTNTASHFPDPDKVPEDFSLPLNHFFETFDNPEVPPLPPRHPVFHDHSPHVHSPAPQVPWTPPRQSHSVRKRGEISLLEGFQSPRTSALLKPLISLNTKEEAKKMADLDSAKIDCEEKLDLFDSLLRRHDPTRMDPVDVQENHKSWCEELSNVLNSLAKSVTHMTVNHRARMLSTSGSRELLSLKTSIVVIELQLTRW